MTKLPTTRAAAKRTPSVGGKPPFKLATGITDDLSVIETELQVLARPMAADAPPVDRLLTVGDVLALTGYRSRTTLWRKVKAGGFPPPRKDGPATVRWRASDIQRWIEGLPAQTYQR